MYVYLTLVVNAIIDAVVCTYFLYIQMYYVVTEWVFKGRISNDVLV